MREEIEVEFRDGSRCAIDPIGQYKIETYSDVYWTDDSKSDFEEGLPVLPGQRVKVKDRRVLRRRDTKWAFRSQEGCRLQYSGDHAAVALGDAHPDVQRYDGGSRPAPSGLRTLRRDTLEFDEYCNTDWCIGDWCMFLRNERDEENGAQQEGLKRRKTAAW